MCYLCDEYGDGDIWYLNPKHYARNMYKLRLPGEGFKGADAAPETGEASGPSTEDLVEALEKGQEEFDSLAQEFEDNVRRHGMQNQIVPLKDAEKVLELCSPIGLISCLCRKAPECCEPRNKPSLKNLLNIMCKFFIVIILYRKTHYTTRKCLAYIR